MDEGYIISNKFRRVIFEGFASGESNVQRIAKKHRIIQNVAIRVTEDFVNNGILEKKGNKFFLTDEGKKLKEKIVD